MAYPRRDVMLSFGGPLTSAVKWLMIANVGAFIVLQLKTAEPLFGMLALVPFEVLRGKAWQLLTYGFINPGPLYLAANLLMLYMFGCQLERIWGFRKFLFYFFLTSLGGGVATVLVGLLIRFPIPAFGPSSSIFGLIIAWALMFPEQEAFLIPFPIAIRAKWFALISIALELLIVWSGNPSLGVALASLGGALTGYVYLEKLRGMPRFRGAYTRWRNRRIAKKFRVVVNENFLRTHDDDKPKFVN